MRHSRTTSAATLIQRAAWPAEGRGFAQPATHAVIVDPFVSSGAAQLARSMIKSRARRRQFFRSGLFSDPAWDILLELFVTEQEGRRASVSTVGLAAQIPGTTALRWINALQQEGLVEREDDLHDARRSFISLTDNGHDAMQAYFGSCDE